MLVAYLVQLSAHSGLVVFETHAELGNTHEGGFENKRETRAFCLKELE
jgi:hypothetical protein